MSWILLLIAGMGATPADDHPSIAKPSEESESSSPSRWAITFLGGVDSPLPCTPQAIYGSAHCSIDLAGASYQLELNYQRAPGERLLGAALENGPYDHPLGVAGFVGARHGWRHLYVEATLGVGIEAQRVFVTKTETIISNRTGTSSQTSRSNETLPGLYGRVVGAIGIPVSASLDVVARLGVHVATNGPSTDFVSASAGLRLKLP